MNIEGGAKGVVFSLVMSLIKVWVLKQLALLLKD